jgi:hypothetical protein
MCMDDREFARYCIECGTALPKYKPDYAACNTCLRRNEEQIAVLEGLDARQSNNI